MGHEAAAEGHQGMIDQPTRARRRRGAPATTTLKTDAAEARARFERLRTVFARLDEVHEELRVITKGVADQTRAVRAELEQTRKTLPKNKRR